MARTNVHALVCKSLFPLDALVVPLQTGATQVGEHDLESRTDMSSNECRVVNIRSCARCFGRRVPHLYYVKSWCCVQCATHTSCPTQSTYSNAAFEALYMLVRVVRSSSAAFDMQYTFTRRVLSILPIITSRYTHRIVASRLSNAAFATRYSGIGSSSTC